MSASSYAISPETVGDNSVLAASHADAAGMGLTPVRALSLVPPTTAKELRRVVLRAGHVGVADEPSVHYTEGSLRWAGITLGRRSVKHQAPPYADCSSFVTWCYWDASRWLDLPDIINNSNWAAGYTGTMVLCGEQVAAPTPGDLAFYGTGVPYHVALFIGGGRVISHGREQGPEIVPVGPVSQYRRYVP